MTNDPSWRVTASRPILSDRWIDLRADDCLTASGTAIAPYYVLRYPDWVNVVALTDDDQVVMVRQYRHALGQVTMELPGGVIDATDASPAEAARRELLEETGFVADEMRAVCALPTNPAIQTHRIHAYAARGARRGGTQALEAGEDGLSVVLVPVRGLLPRLGEGFLGHAMQVSALLLGLAVLGRISLDGSDRPRPGPSPPGG